MTRTYRLLAAPRLREARMPSLGLTLASQAYFLPMFRYGGRLGA